MGTGTGNLVVENPVVEQDLGPLAGPDQEPQLVYNHMDDSQKANEAKFLAFLAEYLAEMHAKIARENRVNLGKDGEHGQQFFESGRKSKKKWKGGRGNEKSITLVVVEAPVEGESGLMDQGSGPPEGREGAVATLAWPQQFRLVMRWLLKRRLLIQRPITRRRPTITSATDRTN